MTENIHVCLACELPSTEIPLLQLEYQGKSFWICPKHLPILIHKPEQLAQKLPGAEAFGSVDHHD